MSNPSIALDLDSTLAATTRTAFDLLNGPDHDYTYNDIESWNWGFEEFGKIPFLNAVWHAWTIRREEIEPNEIGLPHTVAQLRRLGDVDVVTNHPDYFGITEAKQKWVHDNIAADLDVVVGGAGFDKLQLDYDIYVDDKPGLVEDAPDDCDATLIQYHQRYNRHTNPDHRVRTVSDVLRLDL